jgi:hypothetical protein
MTRGVRLDTVVSEVVLRLRTSWPAQETDVPDTVQTRPKNRSRGLGGSVYYLLVGLGLIAAGVLRIRGRAMGAWIYLAVFALTIVWALWEVGVNVGAAIPRVF